MDKKQLEQRCVELTRDFVANRANEKKRKYINSLVPLCDNDFILVSSERPDFVANYGECSYVIEHFLVDFCNDGVNNDQSESRRANRDVMKIYKKYHDPKIGTIKECDIADATCDLEVEMNKLINISLSFDYQKYVDAFRRVFAYHYSRVNDYLSNTLIKGNCTKIGFLIEFHCDTEFMHAIYNNTNVYFNGRFKAFPLTKDIVDIISAATNLDFVIISQFNEGVSVESRDVRIYEPNDVNKSIREQRIKVYDEVYFEKTRKNFRMPKI